MEEISGYRSKTVKQKDIYGIGLGLNIAGEIIKKYNGNITVDSIPVKMGKDIVKDTYMEDETVPGPGAHRGYHN